MRVNQDLIFQTVGPPMRRLLMPLGRRTIRRITTWPDDRWLVSFPRSGNTWCRFLLWNMQHPDAEATFDGILEASGDTTVVSDRDLRALARPRIIKSHDPFTPSYARVVYILRDPRDVAASCYHFHIRLGRISDRYPIEAYIRQFVDGGTFPYGTWASHVLGWTRRGPASGNPFLLIRYEDLFKDPAHELRRMVDFLGLEASEEDVRRAVEASTADRMRESERRNPPKRGRGPARDDVAFVRIAKAGAWNEQLPPSSVRLIEQAWGDVMQEFGYEPSQA